MINHIALAFVISLSLTGFFVLLILPAFRAWSNTN